MKKALFTLYLIFVLFDGISQTVSGKKISEFDAEYIFIYPTSKMMGGKIFVDVDYGQKVKQTTLLKNGEEPRLLNELSKEIEFESMMGVLNFFFDNGYEYVSGFTEYTGTWSGSRNTINCLLRKKKDLK